MANNENVNKVEYGGQTIIDITDTTAETDDVIAGEVFYAKSGARSVGTLSDATQSTHGLMSTTDKIKLDEITTMTGATSSTNGVAGLIPAPTSSDYQKFFRGDGTWQDGGRPMVILSYGSSTWNDFIEAYNNHVIVYCRASSNSNPASGQQLRMAFMAYVAGSADSPTEVEFQYYRSVNSHSATQMSDQVFVYKLTNKGVWSVTTREASVKQVNVSGGGLAASWSNNQVTLTTSTATTSANGMMSAEDKTALENLKSLELSTEISNIKDKMNGVNDALNDDEIAIFNSTGKIERRNFTIPHNTQLASIFNIDFTESVVVTFAFTLTSALDKNAWIYIKDASGNNLIPGGDKTLSAGLTSYSFDFTPAQNYKNAVLKITTNTSGTTDAVFTSITAVVKNATIKPVWEVYKENGEAIEDAINEVNGAIDYKPNVYDSTKTGVDLDVSDPSGNVILRLKDGHIQTKKFDSSEVIDEETLSNAIAGIGEEIISPNIFDPGAYEDSEYVDSSFLLNNGSVSTSSSYSQWMVTPKMSIDSSTEYTLIPKVWSGATGKNRIRAYSSDDTPLAELTITENADGSATFTSPASASYFRMSYFKNQISFADSIENFKETFMLVQGSSVPESYVPYFEEYFKLSGKIPSTGMLQPDFMLPLWYGKKMVNFGDSIFGNIRPPKDMSTKIAQYTGATIYNCAFGGCRMGVHSGHWDAFSMYRLAYAIANNDFSVQDEAIQYDDRTSYAEVPLATLKAIDFSKVDMITIAYGTNDFGGGNENIDNQNNPMDTTTLAGALRYSLDQIMTAFPKICILVLGIIYRDFNGTSSDTYVNARGNTIAEYNAKLKEVAEQYHVRFIDNAHIGFNSYTVSTYYIDGTHPNLAGLEVYARHFANQIN